MTDTMRTELARQFSQDYENVAAELERLAVSIRAKGAHIFDVQPASRLTAANIAADIVHTINWGLANASIERVVKAAGDFDRYLGMQRQGQTATPATSSPRTGPVQPGDIRAAVEELTDLGEVALLRLARLTAQPGFTSVESGLWASAQTADALVERGLLAIWGVSPNKGYCLTPFGRAVAGRLLAERASQALQVTEHNATEGS